MAKIHGKISEKTGSGPKIAVCVKHRFLHGVLGPLEYTATLEVGSMLNLTALFIPFNVNSIVLNVKIPFFFFVSGKGKTEKTRNAIYTEKKKNRPNTPSPFLGSRVSHNVVKLMHFIVCIIIQ